MLGDDLKRAILPGAKLRIAASRFSIYAYEVLKAELERIDSLQFIFTAPTFVPNEVTDKVRKEHRELHIPRLERERGFYGGEFEILLKNKLTQRAIARECAEWMRRKANFRSNHGKAPMQRFACLQQTDANAVYMPLHGFTAVDPGYQQGTAVSDMVNKMDEAPVQRDAATGTINKLETYGRPGRPRQDLHCPCGCEILRAAQPIGVTYPRPLEPSHAGRFTRVGVFSHRLACGQRPQTRHPAGDRYQTLTQPVPRNLRSFGQRRGPMNADHIHHSRNAGICASPPGTFKLLRLLQLGEGGTLTPSAFVRLTSLIYNGV